jgi:hypothetical protein
MSARRVFVRFLHALADGDRKTACRLYPDFSPCSRSGKLEPRRDPRRRRPRHRRPRLLPDPDFIAD